MFLALLLVYAGLTALSLSMDRHYRQVVQRPLNPGIQVVLRLLGACLLAIALVASVRAAAGPLGIVAWFGILPLAGILLIVLLPYAPRIAGFLALVAPVAAVLLM